MKIFRFLVLFAISLPLVAQTSETPSSEARAAHRLEEAKKAGQPELYAFLKNFPKGADLHMHFSGAVYAETFLAEGARQGLCIDTIGLRFTKGADKPTKDRPCSNPHDIPASAAMLGETIVTTTPAGEPLSGQQIYNELIDSFSMRAFEPSEGFDGHDQFFSIFLPIERFSGLKGDDGEWLDEIATRAAAQNEQYLEIMQTPSFSNAAAAGYKIGWPADLNDANHMQVLAKLRDQLLIDGLSKDVAIDEKELADAKAKKDDIESCKADPPGIPSRGWNQCFVQIHWLYQVLRGFPPQQVFAQTLLGFEVASADPDVVGINFVMPEDDYVSMRDYHIQMLMLDYLHSVYPKVHISLHAGELAPGLVPPAGLSFHIRDAIDLGHAERIGHGVDVLYERDPEALLKEMASKHIDVEVNLTSNEVILGVEGKDHPLHAYMAAHVPFSLSTDDEGVSRIDLTHEYVKAVEDQDLTYADLKSSARNSLEYSFLHGQSLYLHPGDYAHRAAACAAPIAARPTGACAAFLGANEKAAQQYELERRFAAFEAALR